LATAPEPPDPILKELQTRNWQLRNYTQELQILKLGGTVPDPIVRFSVQALRFDGEALKIEGVPQLGDKLYVRLTGPTGAQTVSLDLDSDPDEVMIPLSSYPRLFQSGATLRVEMWQRTVDGQKVWAEEPAAPLLVP
jgi:hypothetical protein